MEECEVPRPKTIEAQRDLCQLFNNWIDATTAAEVDGEQLQPVPLQAVHNILIFDRCVINNLFWINRKSLAGWSST